MLSTMLRSLTFWSSWGFNIKKHVPEIGRIGRNNTAQIASATIIKLKDMVTMMVPNFGDEM